MFRLSGGALPPASDCQKLQSSTSNIFGGGIKIINLNQFECPGRAAICRRRRFSSRSGPGSLAGVMSSGRAVFCAPPLRAATLCRFEPTPKARRGLESCEFSSSIWSERSTRPRLERQAKCREPDCDRAWQRLNLIEINEFRTLMNSASHHLRPTSNWSQPEARIRKRSHRFVRHLKRPPAPFDSV